MEIGHGAVGNQRDRDFLELRKDITGMRRRSQDRRKSCGSEPPERSDLHRNAALSIEQN
jgi:hypothetical protein